MYGNQFGELVCEYWGLKDTKKYSRKEKLNEKNSCTPINPKKYSCYGLKHSYKEFDDKKKKKFPTPPITFPGLF